MTQRVRHIRQNVATRDLSAYAGFDTDAYLAAHNEGGRVPWDVFWRIVDDMYVIGQAIDGWSCKTLRQYGIHSNCKTCYPPLKESA